MKINRLRQSILANWPVKILSLTAALIVFLFYRFSTQREFDIPLNIEVTPGFAIASDYPRQVRIILRGLKDIGGLKDINSIKSKFSATLDLSHVNNEGIVTGEVKVERTEEAAYFGALEYEYRPQNIEVLLEVEIDKTVPVQANTAGNPAHGYEAEIILSPPAIVIKGPKSHVEKVNTVYTEEIDLSGRKNSFNKEVKIFMDNPFIYPYNLDKVIFHVSISPIKQVKEYKEVDIVLSGWPSHLKPVIELPKGSIKIRAPQLILEKITVKEMALHVDCSDINQAGEYTFIPEPDITKPNKPDELKSLAEELNVIDYEPKKLKVKFVQSEYREEPND